MIWDTVSSQSCFHWEMGTLPTSWETCMQVKKQQLESDMEKQTGSKSGEE